MVSTAPLSYAHALPAEIICQIIERTNDTPKLDNWCVATESTFLLHQVALRTRWASVEMTQDDLSVLQMTQVVRPPPVRVL